ncbi:hypothetical protein [Mycobacterium sp. 1164985.4]|uniref:hypothetical protein n=1 Tax=Mycobacterium sp. 1164985.4 TaxID=1834069 RepID=UPI0007FC8729|nr:hypothetical protein [Mycobacterium sp. 1164985.4]OBK75438.1 hypothetical protein A5650_17705 [Mycobacterium sp. 1164985.4]
MDITLRSTLIVVTKAAETLGVSLPAGYIAELDKARAIVAGAERFRETSASQLNSAVLDAIEAGRDVHTDTIVQRMMFARNLVAGGIEIDADQRRKEIAHAALLDYADDILASWAEFLKPHAQALADAAEALPSHDLANTEQVTTLTVEGMKHLSNAQIAVKLWAAAIQGFGVLVKTAGPPFHNHTRPLSITPDIGILEFATIRDEAVRERTEVTPWLLAQHGIPLELATITGFAERLANYERQRQAAQEQAEAVQAEARRTAIGR